MGSFSAAVTVRRKHHHRDLSCVQYFTVYRALLFVISLYFHDNPRKQMSERSPGAAKGLGPGHPAVRGGTAGCLPVEARPVEPPAV